MKLFQINEAKLTPFDLQVLNMLDLAPGEWSLDGDRMYHGGFGMYGPSLFGAGLQLQNLRGTANYRELSWRGQLLLKRRHRAITRTAMDVSAKSGLEQSSHMADAMKTAMGTPTFVGRLRSGGKMNPPKAQFPMPSLPPAPTLTATAIQQMQQMQNQMMQPNVAGLQAYQRGAQLGGMVPGAAVQVAAPLSNMVFCGFTEEELVAKGLSRSDLSRLRVAAAGGTVTQDEIDRLVAKVMAS